MYKYSTYSSRKSECQVAPLNEQLQMRRGEF